MQQANPNPKRGQTLSGARLRRVTVTRHNPGYLMTSVGQANSKVCANRIAGTGGNHKPFSRKDLRHARLAEHSLVRRRRSSNILEIPVAALCSHRPGGHLQ